MDTSILALADDMTGALEIGAKFSGAGIEAIVSTKPIAVGTAAAIVIDTETRHVDPETAYLRVRQCIRDCGGAQPTLVYKKTDSTLRGNIAAELRALADSYPEWSIGYAPAYPALGRTVKNGVLYVHGREVCDTEFARDELNPIRSSAIADILHPQLACKVFDGETDKHLTESAAQILSNPAMRIAAGPAGLAERIASMIDAPHRSPPPLPSVRTCLVLNGSRHPRSAVQAGRVRFSGWQIVELEHEAGLKAEEVAARNAKRLVAQLASEQPDAVLIVGGDTAFAVIQELESPLMWPIAEVVPGVPVARIAFGRRDLTLITKAGGFGDEDVLECVHAQLSYGRDIDAR